MASISLVSAKAKPFEKNAAPASPAEARKKSLRSVHMGRDCNRIADLPPQPQSGSILHPRLPLRLPWDSEATIFPTLKGLCLGCAETKIKHTSFQYRRNRVAVD